MFKKIIFLFFVTTVIQNFAFADGQFVEYRCANENLSGESASRSYASPSKVEVFSNGDARIYQSDSIVYPAKKLGSSPSKDWVYRSNQPDRIHSFFVNQEQPTRAVLVSSLKTTGSGNILLQTCQFADLNRVEYNPAQDLVYRCKEKGLLTGKKYPDLTKVLLNDQSRTAQLVSGNSLAPRGTLPSRILTPIFWYQSGARSYFFIRPNMGSNEIQNGSQIFRTAIWTVHKTKREKTTLEDLLICSLSTEP